MVFLQSKGKQKSSRNFFLRDAEYDAVSKRIVIHIQETKKECMMILQKNNARLVNDETSRRNPDFSLVIYLIADKLAQYILVDNNRREKEEAKN